MEPGHIGTKRVKALPRGASQAYNQTTSGRPGRYWRQTPRGSERAMLRRVVVTILAATSLLVAAVPAWACGGLVNPNGTVSLVRTTTLAGYRWGVEHYITSFKFAGGGAEFGSIVPLPGIPKKVTRGGDWTLQRLVREVTPPVPQPESAPTAGGDSGGAEVIYETEIDSLKITILKGGGTAVGEWAENNGFVLSADAPEVLDYYASRSPIFMAARFDPKKARESGKNEGDGVPIHLRIPTDDPWVPLRILGLGLGETAPVNADVFLLTRTEPALLPEPAPAGTEGGFVLERSERASRSLLKDLNSDDTMGWVPQRNMWLSYLRIDTEAGDLKFDLATNIHGGSPSPEDAGLEPEEEASAPDSEAQSLPWLAFGIFGTGSLALARRVFATKR